MKKLSLTTFLIVIKFSLLSAQPTIPGDSKLFGANLRAGTGFTFKGPEQPRTTSNFLKSAVYTQPGTSASIAIYSHIIYDSRSFAEDKLQSADLSARYLAFKANFGYQKDSKQIQQNNSFKIVYTMLYEYQREDLDINKSIFVKYAKGLRDTNDCSAFIKKYGEYFITGRIKGYTASLTITVNTSNSSQFNNELSKFNAEYSGFTYGGKIGLVNSTALKELLEHSELEFEIKADLPKDPEVHQAFGDLQKQVIGFKSTEFKTLTDKVGDFFATSSHKYKPEDARDLVLVLGETKNLFNSCSEMPSLKNEALERIAESYSQNENRSERIVSKVKYSPYKKYLNPKELQLLAKIRDTLVRENNSLKKTFDECNKKFGNCNFIPTTNFSFNLEDKILENLDSIKNKYEHYELTKTIKTGGNIYTFNDTYSELKGKTVKLLLKFNMELVSNADCMGNFISNFICKSPNFAKPIILNKDWAPADVTSHVISIEFDYHVPKTGIVNADIDLKEITDLAGKDRSLSCNSFNLQNFAAIVYNPGDHNLKKRKR